MIEILAQIEGDKFRAGVVLWNDVVIEAAPIVGYMKKQKWTRDQVRKYCERKGWKISVVWRQDRPDQK
jgi:hypothetical protein